MDEILACAECKKCFCWDENCVEICSPSECHPGQDCEEN